MMKKYNKPEIVTLALDVIDVIETSAEEMAADALAAATTVDHITTVKTQITDMNDKWSW